MSLQFMSSYDICHDIIIIYLLYYCYEHSGRKDAVITVITIIRKIPRHIYYGVNIINQEFHIIVVCFTPRVQLSGFQIFYGL